MKKVIQNQLTVVLVLIALMSFVSAQDFSATVTVSGGDIDTDLIFGFSPDATDGYDPGIDAYAPPAPPSGFDAALRWPSQSDERYLIQILAGDGDLSEHVFDIQLQFPEEGVIDLSWDNTLLANLGSYTLLDGATQGGIYNVDMTTESSLQVDNTFITILLLQITPADVSVPTAGFTADVTEGFAPLTVNFSDASTPGTGSIVSWSWDFDNDGTEDATDQNPSYTYTDYGVYTVSLTVVDENGLSDTYTQTDYITVNELISPTADFTSDVTSGQPPLTVNFFDASIPGSGAIVSWSWDFDNDGIEDATDQNPIFTYNDEGVYTVSLTVTDEYDQIDTMTKTDYITIAMEPLWPPANLDCSVTGQVNVHLAWDPPQDPNAIELSYDDGVAENWWFMSDPPAATQHMAVGFTYGEDCFINTGKFNISYDDNTTSFDWNLLGGTSNGPDLSNVLANGTTTLDGDPNGAWYYVDFGGIEVTAGDWFYLDLQYRDGQVAGVDCYYAGGDASDIDPYSWYTVDEVSWLNLGAVTDIMFRAIISTQGARSVTLAPVPSNPDPSAYVGKLADMPRMDEELLTKLTHIPYANPQISSTPRRDLQGYNVYRDGVTINNELITGTNYDDLNLAEGLYEYYVTAVYDGGESEPSNTVEVEIVILPIIEIGNADGFWWNTPLNIWYQNSITEVVYQQEWIGIACFINSVAYHANISTNGINAFGLKIFMGELPYDDLSAGWITADELMLVFDGTVAPEAGDYWLQIDLDEPFIYMNEENLVVMVVKDDDEYYSTSDQFYYTESGISAISRFYYSDFIDPDPYTISEDSNESPTARYSDIQIHFTPLGYGDVAGTVTEAGNGPIEGAVVAIGNSWTTTGSDGTYLLEDISIGGHHITCNAEGYYGTWDIVEVIEDDTVTVDFALEPLVYGAIEGTVTDSETGDPIEGAEITVSGYNEYTSTTNSLGYYLIEDIVAGTYDVTCSAENYLSQTEENVVISADVITTIDFALEFSIGTVIVCDLDPTPTGTQLVSALENLFGGMVVYETSLSENPLDETVKALFLLLGIYSNNYVLTEADAVIITPYLDAGGNVYMEGGDTWAYDAPTSLHTYFNINPLADGSGDLFSIAGITSFWDGMTWGYVGENSWIDQLSAISPAVDILQNPSAGYVCGVAYDADTYKTIGTSFEITGMVEGNRETFEVAVANALGFFGLFEFDYGSLAGNVTELSTGAVIEDATVTCGSYVGVSDVDGYYEINEILVGSYSVTCEAEGYNVALAEGIEIVVEETTTLDFALTAPTMEVYPLELIESIPPDETYTTYITISNNGNGPLGWSGSITTFDRNMEIPEYPSYVEMLRERYLEKVESSSSPELAPQGAPNAPFGEVVSLRDEDSQAFGYMTYDPTGQIPNGPISFILNDPGTLTPFGYPASDFVATADWVDDVWYGIIYGGTLITIDMETGDITTIGSTLDAPGMAYDWTTGTMYGVDFYGSLCTIDLETGAYTQVATTQSNLITIACSNDGILYGFDLSTDTFGMIDKETGEWTQIGAVGFDFSYAQDASFDHSTNTLYWACYDVALGGELLTVDLETGVTSFIGAFPGGAEVTGFTVPGAPETWIAIDPHSGAVEAGESGEVAVIFDGTDIPVGTTLIAEIIFTSDPDVGTETVDVTLTVGDLEFGSISGTVTLEDTEYSTGNVEDVVVTAGNYSTSPDPAGYYYFEVYPNTYDVTASLYGYEDQTIEDVVVEELVETPNINFDLNCLFGALTGNVTDFDTGEPIAGVSVAVLDAGPEGDDLEDETDESGHYEITGIIEGSYDVEATHDAYISYTVQDVEIVQNIEVSQDFILQEVGLPVPRNLTASEDNPDGVLVSWLPPAGGGPVGAILCVDRDGSTDGSYTDDWSYFQAALDANGYDYDYYEVTDISLDGPDYETMQGYDIIIWFSGEAWGYYGDDCMTSTDENNLAAFLDGGGALFLSAHDYLNASYPSAGSFYAGQFPYDYLGMRSVAQDNWNIFLPATATIEGVAGSCTEGFTFDVQDIYTTGREGLYIDWFIDHDGVDLFNVTSPTPEGICANQYETAAFRTIFTTASFAAITDPTIQADLLDVILQHLSGGGVTNRDFLGQYNVFRSDTPGIPYEMIAEQVTETSYLDTDVALGETWYYVATALYDTEDPYEESPYSNEDSGSLFDAVPPAPENVTVTGTDSAVVISWDEVIVTEDDIDSYNIYKKYMSGDFELIGNTSETSYDYILVDGQGLYYFQVTTLDLGGQESDPSESVMYVYGTLPPTISATSGVDEAVPIQVAPWGTGTEIEFIFDDGFLANAFYFYATYEDGFAHGTRFNVGGNFDVLEAKVKILSEGDPYWPWPNATHGPVRVMIFDDSNGYPGTLLHDEEVVAEDGWATITPNIMGLNETFYVITSHTEDWSTGGDPEGYGIDGFVDFPNNMVTLDGGTWYDGDWLGYGGDYMIRATVLSLAGVQTYSYSDDEITTYEHTDEFFKNLPSISNSLHGNRESSEQSANLDHEVIHWSYADNINVRDHTGYYIYKSLDGISFDMVYEIVGGGPQEWIDTDVVNDNEYWYYATAIYDYTDESDPSETVSAIPHDGVAPGPITDLVYTVDVENLTVDFTWADPAINADGSPCTDLAGIEIYRNGSLLTTVDPGEEAYADEVVTTGSYVYTFYAIDEVPNQSEPVVSVVYVEYIVFAEDFFSGEMPPAGWTVTGDFTNNWQISETSYAGGVAPEGQFYWLPDYGYEATARLVTPVFNTTGMVLELEFKHMLDFYSGSVTIGVATTSNGGATWNDVWSVNATDDISAETIILDINTPDEGSSTFQLCFFFTGDPYDINHWYIDDITLNYEPYEVTTQVIYLATGWNIFSTYIIPSDLNMLSVVQPLIDDDNLIRVLDEEGNTIVYFMGNWVNMIGDLANSEGYYIKVSDDTDLIIEGESVSLPFEIDLSAGWNIMGYPTDVAQDGMNVVQPLIDAGELVRVVDEEGNSIVYFMGNWVNMIGDFEAGEGYYTKVNTTTSLTINASALARAEATPVEDKGEKPLPTHFIPVYYGNPFMPMAIYLIGDEFSHLNLDPGDEVSVFDGELCVGTSVVEDEISIANPLVIITSMDDGIGMLGFIEGNSISYRVWDASENSELVVNEVANYDVATGDELNSKPLFEGLGINAIRFKSYVGEKAIPESFALHQNYPNPFNPMTTIRYELPEQSHVTIVIYDMLGRSVRQLVNSTQDAGYRSAIWDATDNFGKPVSAGIYLYQINAGEFTQTRKLVLLKQNQSH